MRPSASSLVGLPAAWPTHVKSGLLHAVSLASTALTVARSRASTSCDSRRRLQVRLERANNEIALLKEELDIKDARWIHLRSKRRPHYTSIQRMRILQLRAARGWSAEKTAELFLIDEQTLASWMRRLDEQGEGALVQTAEPVNRYPDFVRHLMRQLKVLLPTMGNVRIVQTLARAGLHLGPTTVRRFIREMAPPPQNDEVKPIGRRRVAAKYPGHTWHLDLTAVPTRAGFWVPWFPSSLPQSWPFCWWVAVAIDQFSRSLFGFAVFTKCPSSTEVRRFLAAAVRSAGRPPRYIVTDKGRQFWCHGYKRWCRRRGIRPRYGAVGERGSIAFVERFIRSMKQECTRTVIIPLSIVAMRRELRLYAIWYNIHRPHMAIAGNTPAEIYAGRIDNTRRFEPRPKWPHQRPAACADRVRLEVGYLESRKHLPIITLRRAA